jgi:hypothetical protein
MLSNQQLDQRLVTGIQCRPACVTILYAHPVEVRLWFIEDGNVAFGHRNPLSSRCQ